MSNTTEFSIPLPRSIDTRIYIRLTVLAKCITIFLTTASAAEEGRPTPLGSFVYALPDRFNPREPLCTPLYIVEPTLDFTSRVAKLLVRKTHLPVYVGNSISLIDAGMGGTVEEEMEAFKAVAEVVVDKAQELMGFTNGVGSLDVAR